MERPSGDCLTRKPDMMRAVEHILSSNGMRKSKGKTFLLQALEQLDKRELFPVYVALLKLDEEIHNKPPS